MKEGTRLGSCLLKELIAKNRATRTFRGEFRADTLSTPCVVRCAEVSHSRAHAHMLVSDGTVASRFEHRSVARVLDTGIASGVAFVATERIEGVDLLTAFGLARRARAPFPVEVALLIVLRACDALEYIHGALAEENGRPCAHQNVALSNLMITPRGEVKLLDYGVSGSASIGEDGDVGAGRSDYMAPELLLGGVPNPRSDVFSLGVVLHELLTGHRLFHKDGHEVDRDPNGTDEIRPPSTIRRDLSPSLERAVMRALSHDPSKRFPNAGELKEALREDLDPCPEEEESVLASFVLERFGELLREEPVRGPSSDSSVVTPRSEGVDLGGLNPAHAAAPRAEEACPPVESSSRPVISSEAALRLVGGLALLFVLGVAVMIFWQERYRAPDWSLEAWRESQGGAMAGARPIEAIPEAEAPPKVLESSPEPAREAVSKRAKTVDQETSAAPTSTVLTGQLILRCQGRCTLFVDEDGAGLQVTSEPFTLLVGQRDLRIVDDSTGREERRRVLIAPGRVLVEEVRFTPTFMERTGTEDW